jgi:hypothetical protein
MQRKAILRTSPFHSSCELLNVTVIGAEEHRIIGIQDIVEPILYMSCLC